MNLLKNLLFLLLLLFTFQSCTKSQEEKAKIATELPNFGNIDVNDIFHRKDNRLKNKDSIVSVLDNYYKNVWEKGDLWGGFLVAKGDDILYENYNGFAQDGKQVPIDKDVALHVASVSKTLTAMATLKLVDAGKLKLEDHLTDLFPGFPYPEVTVLHCCPKDRDCRNMNISLKKFRRNLKNFQKSTSIIRMF